jgi:ABC-type transporter Mla maintaining outer membrane lipid asymmetry ATPase subunit MlaF
MSAPVVEVRGLVNRFGRQVVHDGLDLCVQRGEVFGVVGGSGGASSVAGATGVTARGFLSGTGEAGKAMPCPFSRA